MGVMMKLSKCNYMNRAKIWQEREVGCPLDHCACGTHNIENKEHECEEESDIDPEIAAAELSAGWDPNP